MKSIHIALAVFIIVYSVLFIRWPKVDYQRSVYALECVGPDSYHGKNFDRIQGSELDFTKNKSDRLLTPKFRTVDSDVIAKFICGNSGELDLTGLPTDPQLYAERVVSSPDYARVSLLPPNYKFVVIDAAHTPSIASAALRALILALILLGGSYFVRK